MPHLAHPSRAAALTLIGAAALARPARAQSQPKIRVGVGVVESYSQGAYAQELGFYKSAGLDVEVTALANGGAITAAVIGGALDVGTTNSGSMALAYLRGLPIYLIAPSGIYTSASPTTVLVVNKDAAFQSARDLNGKTISVTTLQDLQQAAIMKWIDDNGGDAKSVKFVEITNPGLVASLVAHRTDATALLEPQLTERKDDVRIFANAYDAVAKQFLISGWIVTKDWYAKNTAAAQKFVQVMRQTAEWANKNPRDSAAILSKLSKIPLETVQKMNHNVFGTTMDLALVQPCIDVVARYGFLPRSFPAAEMLPPK